MQAYLPLGGCERVLLPDGDVKGCNADIEVDLLQLSLQLAPLETGSLQSIHDQNYKP